MTSTSWATRRPATTCSRPVASRAPYPSSPCTPSRSTGSSPVAGPPSSTNGARPCGSCRSGSSPRPRSTRSGPPSSTSNDSSECRSGSSGTTARRRAAGRRPDRYDRDMAVIASIFVALAALLHGYIFLLESVRWTHPRTWRIFGVPSQEHAAILKPMAYNQGLGLGAAIGLVLYWSGAVAPGLTLMLFTTACMALAAAVLATGGRRYVRPALVQGTLPLIGFVLLLFA